MEDKLLQKMAQRNFFGFVKSKSRIHKVGPTQSWAEETIMAVLKNKLLKNVRKVKKKIFASRLFEVDISNSEPESKSKLNFCKARNWNSETKNFSQSKFFEYESEFRTALLHIKNIK